LCPVSFIATLRRTPRVRGCALGAAQVVWDATRAARVRARGLERLDERHGAARLLFATAFVVGATPTRKIALERTSRQTESPRLAPEGFVQFATQMLLADVRRGTVAGDKNYDMRRCVGWLRGQGLTPHVAAKRQFSAIDRRTTRHPGYAVSQQKRKLVEQVFGWMKTIGTLRKLRHRGGERVDWTFTFAAAAYNLVRLRTLGAASW
jgi:hypothetical protein